MDTYISSVLWLKYGALRIYRHCGNSQQFPEANDSPLHCRNGDSSDIEGGHWACEIYRASNSLETTGFLVQIMTRILYILTTA